VAAPAAGAPGELPGGGAPAAEPSTRPDAKRTCDNNPMRLPSRSGDAITVTLSPVFISAAFQPVRASMPVLPASNPQISWEPSAFATPRYSQECGLAHSHFSTVPFTEIFFVMSNRDAE